MNIYDDRYLYLGNLSDSNENISIQSCIILPLCWRLKDAKFQLRPEKWYKVDYLITDAKTDYKMEFMSQYLNYINSLVSNIFGCLLLCSQNGIQLMSLSVPICFWNLLFEMLTMAKDRFPQGFVLFAILCIIRSVVLFFW